MFNIETNGTICLSRGDTADISLAIYGECEDGDCYRYIPKTGDEIYFSVSIYPEDRPARGD